VRTLKIPRGIFNAVRYTADGEYLVGLHSGWRLRVWATSDFSERYTAPLPGIRYSHWTMQLGGDYAVMSQGVYSLAAMWAAVRATAKRVTAKDLIQEVRHERGSGGRSELVLGPDGKTVYELHMPYASRATSELSVMSVHGEVRQRHEVHPWTRRPAISPDGKCAALLNGDRILLFDFEQRKVIDELHHTAGTERALFSPDGAQLAVGASRSLWLWDLSRRKGERHPAFQTYVEGLAYTPDGSRLAVADRTGEIRVLESATGRQLGCLNFEVGAIHDLAFSPDGMTVAGAGHHDAVVVWDLE
jgi:WD40 repeat protein